MKIPDETRQREIFLNLIKEFRKESGRRQIELAEELGVPQSFVSKYEAGDRKLDILELRQICQFLGVSLEDFVHQLEEKLHETK